uniref:Uncharacterized protein n=1 Tax=Peronospora matthiolae TaxID=2874970 RepID=A0AAV1V1Z5_9STRA
MPDAQQRKLALQPFDGKELYHGLGCGFMEWGKEFVRQVGFAEQACGFVWPEDIKVDVLGQHLAGKAQTYYRRQVETWWFENQTLEHAMQRLLQTFTTKISPAQSMELFTAPKASHRNWTDHFLYLTAVSDACGGADNLVLDNIVHYADPHMRTTMLSRLDIHRTDYLRQAEELAQFAQSTEVDTHSKIFGRDVVNTVEVAREFKDKRKSRPSLSRTDTRTCFKCGEVGHIRSRCPKMKKKPSGANFVFAVGRGASRSPGQWILDSGSSRHLVNDPSLLTDPIDCRSECMTAATDGSALRITLQGTVDIQVVALGVVNTVRLLNVQYAENLERNILSYGLLEAKGCVLEYRGGRRVLSSGTGGAPIMDVECCNNVLVVAVTNHSDRNSKPPQAALMTVVNPPEYESDSDVLCGTLMDFHRRLGHLCFDTIVKMANDPASCIRLTDSTRQKCLACAQGKQTKGAQSKRDTGANSPIDAIGGVICSDLKGPMTPRDRLGNRYMVNFIDHRSSYCRIFLAKSKNAAALKFKLFMANFEREFNCKVHVLRTDGGGEYKTLDIFCSSEGVLRQVSEAKNQASNGKAERMHRTVMNMVRSMIFASNLPLSFWGDAAEYASYILNRSKTKSNPGCASPLEILTGKAPVLTDIVAFGSTCTAHRDPKNKSLGERGKAGIVIGRGSETKGYKVYIPVDKVVVVTQHVQNIEAPQDDQDERKTCPDTARRQEELGPDHQADEEDRQDGVKRAKQVRKGRKSTWTRERHGTRSTTSSQPKVVEVHTSVDGCDIVNAIVEQDPKHYGEAMKSGQRDQWQAAMTEELDALEANDVWKIVVPPRNAHVLHNKWVYKTKTDANGDIERYKA